MAGNRAVSGGTSLPSSLVTIFGATVDLTKCLLLPSIYHLAAAQVLPENTSGDEARDDAELREHFMTTLTKFWGTGLDDGVVVLA
jgi:glucose-6-phosphate 1-dehydrogenase